MFVVSQNRKEVVNADNVRLFYVYRNIVVAQFRPGQETDLGKYVSDKRAEEVFEQMLKECFPPSTVIFQNVDMPSDFLERIERENKKVIENAVFLEAPEQPVKFEKFDLNCWYMPEE